MRKAGLGRQMFFVFVAVFELQRNFRGFPTLGRHKEKVYFLELAK